jgi:hypothetical protein
MQCLDCGNTEYFRQKFIDWSLLEKTKDGDYQITDSLCFGEDTEAPIECHDCDSHNIQREDV